jgi:predicted DNA-binding transcriptional regulator YafY
MTIKRAPSGTLEGVVIGYTNHRGQHAERNILPVSIEFGSTQWHPEPQWILVALDMDKRADRHFAMKDITSWRPKVK